MQLQFESVQAFLQMGNHGTYVWLCFGLTAFVLALNVWLTISRKKSITQEIIKQQARNKKQTLNYSTEEKPAP